MSTLWAKIFLFILHRFCLSSHSCPCCIRQANLSLNPDRSVSHTYTQIPERRRVCVSEREKLTLSCETEWMWRKEWNGGMMGVRGLRNSCVSYAYTQKHTQTHTRTVSLASIEHQEINLLFPLIWWKRRDSLTLRRQFLSPNIPSLSPSLSLSCVLLSLPSFLPPLSPASLVTVKRPK